MNDHVVDLILISLAVLTVFAAGAAFGVYIADRIWSRVLERTGTIRKETDEPTGAVHSRAPVNTEESARRNIAAASLERGALDIQQRYKENGRNISLKEARAEAAAMLSANDALGGVT